MVTFLMATMRWLALHLDDAVDEKEGVAVGEEGHDLADVHGLGLWDFFAHGSDEYKWREWRTVAA